MSSYLYPHDGPAEGDRLATLESLWDPTTIDRLQGLPVVPGWRCLEVGAGSGSVAAWLAGRVGPIGHVTATDIDTTHLAHLADVDGDDAPNLTVQQHDVTTDPLPDATYDLIHARLLLKHLPARDRVLERFAASLRPDGWLVVEDTDWTTAGLEPRHDAFDALLGGLRALMVSAGGIHDYGRQLPGALHAAGLTDVTAVGTVLTRSCGTPAVDFYRLTFAQVHDRLIAAALVDEAAYAAALAALDDTDRVAFAPVLVSAQARRPRA